MKAVTRRIAAGVAALTLTAGLVACSEAEDAVTEATDTAGSALNEAGDSAESAVNGEGDAEGSEGAETSEDPSAESEGEDSGEASEAAGDGETQTISTPAGDFEVPAGFASAIESKVSEWGEVTNISTEDFGSVAEFENMDMLAWTEDAQDIPVVGKIAEVWKNEGGLDSDLGLPTGPEQTEGTGWIQEFANGTISWLQGDNGEYTETIEMN